MQARIDPSARLIKQTMSCYGLSAPGRSIPGSFSATADQRINEQETNKRLYFLPIADS
jgi:hypothetical protein